MTSVPVDQNTSGLGPSPVALPRWVIAALGALVLAMGSLSLWLGQDASWDLRNYHWYNAYAFWTDRLAFDEAPAQIPSFYNPTLDIPFYLLASAVPAAVTGFILGAIQGLNALPLFGLAWLLLPILSTQRRALVALGVAAAGLVGGGHIGLVGTTFYDNIISLLVLGSAWVIVAKADAIFQGPLKRAFTLVALAGLLVGSGVGLKQPTVVFAVGLCFAFLLVSGSPWRRLFTSFFFGIGVLAGMALFSGHWMLHLWLNYGNPLFPYFNDLFQSPMGTMASYRDDKFIPTSLERTLLFPFFWTLDPKLVGEIIFRDLRIPVAYSIMLATPILLLWAKLRSALAPSPATPATRYVLIAAAISYLVWLKLFAIYRYVVPLEILAPLLIVMAVMMWPMSLRVRAGLALALILLVSVTARPGNWSRIPWSENFVEIQAPALPDPDRTLILMTGYAPTSFLVTGFPPQIPFLRLQSYLIHPDHGDVGINRRMSSRIAAHTGDFYLLLAPWETWTVDNVLPHYGLTADLTTCRPVTSNLDEPMRLCYVTRRTDPPTLP